MSVKFINTDRNRFLSERRLFRVISFNRVLEMFYRKRLVFVSPSQWEDPYEKEFLNAKIIIKGEKHYLPLTPDYKEGKFRVFCQCWTATAESDAFWKSYSPNRDGIRLAVYREKLLELLDQNDTFDIFIGKVKYYNSLDFRSTKSIAKEIDSTDFIKTHIRLLLRKRYPYKYENEYRILLRSKEDRYSKNVSIQLDDPGLIFRNFKINPWMGEYQAMFIKENFKEKICKNSYIVQSRLSFSKKIAIKVD